MAKRVNPPTLSKAVAKKNETVYRAVCESIVCTYQLIFPGLGGAKAATGRHALATHRLLHQEQQRLPEPPIQHHADLRRPNPIHGFLRRFLPIHTARVRQRTCL